MRQLDKDAVSAVNYRRKALKRELRNIENAVNGRGLIYLPRITDEGGRVVEECVEGLIGEMLQALKRYRKAAQPFFQGLTDETEELYRCFLYCAIQGIAWEEDLSDYSMAYGDFDRAQTFADLVNMAKDPRTTAVREREALMLAESNALGVQDFGQGFFSYGNAVYELLTGKPIYDSYSQAEKMWVDERNSAELKAMDEANEQAELEAARSQGCETLEEYYSQMDCGEALSQEEALEDWEESLTEEDKELLQWEQEAWQEAEQRKAALAAGIADPERYIQRYLRYRELYFTVAPKRLPQDIEDMVDAYLYERGASPFSLGDAYGLVSHKLKQIPGMLRSEVRRARRTQ